MPTITLPTPGSDLNIWGPILNTAVNTINGVVDLNLTHVVNGALYVTANGSTDDTTGFNSAVAAAQSTGRELVLPPGTIITSGVSITPTAPLKIRGSGMGRTIIKLVNAASPIHLLRINAGTSHRVELSDFTLDGNNVTQSTDVLASLLKLESRNDGMTVVHHVEIKNGNKTGCVAYNSAIKMTDCWVHDIVLEGITPHANYTTVIANNLIESCTRNGIRIGSSATTTKYAGVLTIVANNTIRNITDAFSGTGQYGNGILVYRVSDVIVTGNSIMNVAWAFVRANRADNVVISNNIGVTNTNQQGIFVEFNSQYATIVGNKITSSQGITVTNVDTGSFGSTVTGNVVRTTYSGNYGVIHCETGVVANNVLDGGGTAAYGVRQIGGATALQSQLTVKDNHIAGVKYAIGVPLSNTHASSFTEISGNRVTRKDANWSSFIGAVGGSTTDAGNGSAITTYGPKMFIDQPSEGIATGEAPPSAVVGSRIIINSVLKTWNGTAWA